MTQIWVSKCFCLANKQHKVCRGGWVTQDCLLMYVEKSSVCFNVFPLSMTTWFCLSKRITLPQGLLKNQQLPGIRYLCQYIEKRTFWLKSMYLKYLLVIVDLGSFNSDRLIHVAQYGSRTLKVGRSPRHKVGHGQSWDIMFSKAVLQSTVVQHQCILQLWLQFRPVLSKQDRKTYLSDADAIRRPIIFSGARIQTRRLRALNLRKALSQEQGSLSHSTCLILKAQL